MTNPAGDLIEVIEQWRSQIGKAGNVALRDSRGANDVDTAGQHVRAMAALAQVTKVFDRYAEDDRTDVAHLFASYAAWVRMVTAQGQDWSARANVDALFPPRPMSDLRSLRAIINADDRQLPNDIVDELRARVLAVRETLAADDTLPDFVRRSLEVLLNDFERVLNAKPTESDYRETWEQVAVALVAAGATSENAEPWHAVATRWGMSLVTQIAAGIASGVATTAITGG